MLEQAYLVGPAWGYPLLRGRTGHQDCTNGVKSFPQRNTEAFLLEKEIDAMPSSPSKEISHTWK